MEAGRQASMYASDRKTGREAGKKLDGRQRNI